MIIRLVKATVGNFEYNPEWQYRFHLWMAWFWLASIIIMPLILRPHKPDEWIALLILEVSLYANFTSDFTGMSASMGATNVKPKPKPFENPNYKPEEMKSLGLGWGDQDSAGYDAVLDEIAADEVDF